jgi:hypothetical protein
VDRRIFGLENEYGVTCTLRGQRRLSPDEVVDLDEELDDLEARPRRRRYGVWVALVLAGLLVLSDVLAIAGRWS